MTDLFHALLDACDWCEAHHIHQPFIKRRDKREPGRREKETAEEKLQAAILRRFKRQAKRVREKLEAYYPDRKAVTLARCIPITDEAAEYIEESAKYIDAFVDKALTESFSGDAVLEIQTNRLKAVDVAPPDTWLDDMFDDDESDAELLKLLMAAVKDGIYLFDQRQKLHIDYTLTNTEAAEWARNYAADLLKKIDTDTRSALQTAITQFIETPGFTIRDVMDSLPFDERRSQMIAVTEVTRTYAHGEQIAGEALRDEFPEAKVRKVWFTNNDDLVCPLCGPLDGTEVGIDELFYDIENDTYQDGNPPYHPNCRCWMEETLTLEE